MLILNTDCCRVFFHSNISNMNLSDLLLSDLLATCKFTHVQVSDVGMHSLYTSGVVNVHVFWCGSPCAACIQFHI